MVMGAKEFGVSDMSWHTKKQTLHLLELVPVSSLVTEQEGNPATQMTSWVHFKVCSFFFHMGNHTCIPIS